MKSRRHNRSTKRSRWAWCNSPAGLRHRRALHDARCEERAASLPPIPPEPEPGSLWQRVVVYGSHGQVMREIALYVPARGVRCDQHCDEAGALLTATEVGRQMAAWICKRPSIALQAQERAELVAGAREAARA
jgi:hypothetical protein